MSGLVAWLAIIVFVVSLNRVFGALGRGMTEEDGSEGGSPPGGGGAGRSHADSLREALLREISEAAEREARARAAQGSRSEIHWTGGPGGAAPLGVAGGGRAEDAGSGARTREVPATRTAPRPRLRAERVFGADRPTPDASRTRSEVPGRTPGRDLGAQVGTGTREIGEGPVGSSTPGPGSPPGVPGAGHAAGAGAAATLPAWPRRTALQRAVLYEAILGPPLALRGEREGPGAG